MTEINGRKILIYQGGKVKCYDRYQEKKEKVKMLHNASQIGKKKSCKKC